MKIRKLKKLFSFMLVIIFTTSCSLRKEYPFYQRSINGNIIASCVSTNSIPSIIVTKNEDKLIFTDDYLMRRVLYKCNFVGSLESYCAYDMETENSSTSKWAFAFISETNDKRSISMVLIGLSKKYSFKTSFNVRTTCNEIISIFNHGQECFVLAKKDNNTYQIYSEEGKVVYEHHFKEPTALCRISKRNHVVGANNDSIGLYEITSKSILQLQKSVFIKPIDINTISYKQPYYSALFIDNGTFGMIYKSNIILYNYLYNSLFFENYFKNVKPGLAYQLFPYSHGNVFICYDGWSRNNHKYYTYDLFDRPYNMLYYDRYEAINLLQLYFVYSTNDSSELAYIRLNDSDNIQTIHLRIVHQIPDKIINILADSDNIYAYSINQVYVINFNDPNIIKKTIKPDVNEL